MANPQNLIGHEIRPGQVLNPTGKNQYSYRKEAEKSFERLLSQVVDTATRKTVADEILERLVGWARNGNVREAQYAMDRILERILPKVEKHEHTGTVELQVPQLDEGAGRIEAVAEVLGEADVIEAEALQ